MRHTAVSAEMRAVVVERPGAARLQRVPRPEPGPGEVLVRVGAAGICGSDVEVLEGRRPARYVRYPIIPGHEWAGMVVAVGPGVENVNDGDAVVAEGFRACGRCARCSEGRTNLCAATSCTAFLPRPTSPRPRCSSPLPASRRDCSISTCGQA